MLASFNIIKVCFMYCNTWRSQKLNLNNAPARSQKQRSNFLVCVHSNKKSSGAVLKYIAPPAAALTFQKYIRGELKLVLLHAGPHISPDKAFSYSEKPFAINWSGVVMAHQSYSPPCTSSSLRARAPQPRNCPRWH